MDRDVDSEPDHRRGVAELLAGHMSQLLATLMFLVIGLVLFLGSLSSWAHGYGVVSWLIGLMLSIPIMAIGGFGLYEAIQRIFIGPEPQDGLESHGAETPLSTIDRSPSKPGLQSGHRASSRRPARATSGSIGVPSNSCPQCGASISDPSRILPSEDVGCDRCRTSRG